MKVMIVAGEASGDMHGARLAREIMAIEPTARLFGMGGSRMRSAGVRLLYDPTRFSAVGFVEALKSVRVLHRVLRGLVQVMERQEPDVLVVIDFPDFNMRLAEMAKGRGIPVVYYVSPSVWAWRRGRAEKIARIVDCVCPIFPFEVEIYRQVGAPVCYCGNPLIDSVHPDVDRDQLLRELGFDPQAPFFALLPGSREQEIKTLLEPMLKAAALITERLPQAQFAVAPAHTVPDHSVAGLMRYADGAKVAVVKNRTYDVLAAADAAIVASGTATLEAALLDTPMVMVYKLTPSTYHIAKLLVKTPYVALPNVVAGRAVVTELLQHEVQPEAMAAEILSLWHDKERRQQMLSDFAEVRRRLGKPGAVARTAQVVMCVARGQDFAPYCLEPDGGGG
ncbi:MAG: lipid-A-disaccharide synthase [Firmicutes bacterium]|nr:lipid-A-disaccharide synthase [Bacillota bacterium]